MNKHTLIDEAIVEKLVALGQAHDGDVATYFDMLYRGLKQRLKSRNVADDEIDAQLIRLGGAIEEAQRHVLFAVASEEVGTDPSDGFSEPGQAFDEGGDAPVSEGERDPADDQASGDDDGKTLFVLKSADGLTATPENSVTFDEDAGTFELRSWRDRASSSRKTNTVYATLSSEIEALASGRTVRVVFRARSADEDGSSEMAVCYSTAGMGNSRWKHFDVGPEPAENSFVYEVPQHQGEPGHDFIGIWADPSGQGRGIILEALTLSLEDA